MTAGLGRRRPAWPASRPCAQPACPSAGSRPALPPKLASASSKPCPAPSWAPLGLLCPVPAVFGAGASRHRHRSARHARAPGRETRGVDRRWRACGIVCGPGKTGRAGKTTRAAGWAVPARGKIRQQAWGCARLGLQTRTEPAGGGGKPALRVGRVPAWRICLAHLPDHSPRAWPCLESTRQVRPRGIRSAGFWRHAGEGRDKKGDGLACRSRHKQTGARRQP